jgi:hypothetical protein
MKELTHEELTKLYKEANKEVGKSKPITTVAIFKAMQAAYAQGQADLKKELEASTN